MTFSDDPAHLSSLEAACNLKFAKTDFLENEAVILDFQELLLCKLIDVNNEEYASLGSEVGNWHDQINRRF